MAKSPRLTYSKEITFTSVFACFLRLFLVLQIRYKTKINLKLYLNNIFI